MSILNSASQSLRTFCVNVDKKYDLNWWNERLNALFAIYAAVVLILVGFIPTYWLFIQSENVLRDIETPVVTMGTSQSGQILTFSRKYCKDQKIHGSVRYTLVPENSYSVPSIRVFSSSVKVMRLNADCRHIVADIPLPLILPFTSFSLEVTTIFEINPLKTVENTWTSPVLRSPNVRF